MDKKLKDHFLVLWNKYFDDAELPITFYYTDDEGHVDLVKPGTGHRCVIGQLAKVRVGESLRFNVDSIGCPGGKRYLGFTDKIRPEFEHFLSYGIPGKMEGERYKKSPELVRQTMATMPVLKAPGRFIVFKRWDTLEESDTPEVVIFFARPDVLSGLFTLASFDVADPTGVIAPFGAGCGSIVQHPYLQKDASSPKAVLGMFDPSARHCVPEDTLTFAVPMNRFTTMVNNAEESFLITGTWDKIRNRIAGKGNSQESGS